MRKGLSFALVACLPLSVAGCPGDDGSSSGTDGGSGSATSTDSGSASDPSGSPTSVDSTGNGSDPTDPTDPTGATDPTTGNPTTGPSDSTGATGDCSSVVVTYDLEGSRINIDAIVDFEITVQPPYDEDLNTGPGTMTIRFATDDSGTPLPGSASILDYSLVQNFVTGSAGLATVTTDLTGTSGPDECGVATGMFDGVLLTFDAPPQMDPYCLNGTITCNGTFCGMGGSPPQGMPQQFVDDCADPHPLDTFAFAGGVDTFTSPPIITSMGDGSTVTMTFAGTATSMEVDDATPACACP